MSFEATLSPRYHHVITQTGFVLEMYWDMKVVEGNVGFTLRGQKKLLALILTYMLMCVDLSIGGSKKISGVFFRDVFPGPLFP